jgi:virginiamycin B lyase
VADGQGRLLRVALPVSQAEPVSGVVDVGWLASAGGWVWATSGGELLRIDPVDGRLDARILSSHPATWASAGGLVSGQDSLWLGATGPSDALLVRLDPGTGQPERVIQVAGSAEQYRPKMAAGRRVVAARVGQDLYLVDPATGSIRATVELGNTLGGVATDADTVWATDPTRGRLLRVDPGF